MKNFPVLAATAAQFVYSRDSFVMQSLCNASGILAVQQANGQPAIVNCKAYTCSIFLMTSDHRKRNRGAENVPLNVKQEIKFRLKKSKLDEPDQETVKVYRSNKQTSILSREFCSHNVFHYLYQKQLGIPIHDRLKKVRFPRGTQSVEYYVC